MSNHINFNHINSCKAKLSLSEFSSLLFEGVGEFEGIVMEGKHIFFLYVYKLMLVFA